MNDYSEETLSIMSTETLHRIELDNLIELGICNKDNVLSRDGGLFSSRNRGDYTTLGSCIGRNTKLQTLYVELEGIRLSATNSGFFEGIKQNSSINKFKLNGFSYIGLDNQIGEVGCEILKAFQENNNHLTALHIWACDLSNADERFVISTTLSSCTNLKTINLTNSGLNDEQLSLMVEAMRGRASLQELHLWANRIGNTGCQALATLLQDPSCNLVTLDIHHNQIGNEGAIAIANSLANDDKLKKLDLRGNQIGNESAIAIANSLASNNKLMELDLRGIRMDDSLENTFSGVLCDTTSINATYSSNHTLSKFAVGYEGLQEERIGIELMVLLNLNRGINKKYVAIKKILQHHPNIDMEPFFELGSGDERNLMALPYVIDWFDRAEEAVEYYDEESDDSSDYDARDDQYDYQVEKRKLSAIYEFALAMPLMFIPTSDKKRKRVS